MLKLSISYEVLKIFVSINLKIFMTLAGDLQSVLLCNELSQLNCKRDLTGHGLNVEDCLDR